jgi:hypothetical protein
MALSDAAQLAFGAKVDEEVARARANSEAFRSSLSGAVASLTALGESAQSLAALKAISVAEGVALGAPANAAITAAKQMAIKAGNQVLKASAVDLVFDSPEKDGLTNAFAALLANNTALKAA